MLRLATDADVNGDIIHGLRRRLSALDLVRAQDFLGATANDEDILAWAAAETRVLITNDRNTMIGFACQRVARGESVPGLIVTSNSQSIGAAIDDLALLVEYMSPAEVSQQLVVYLPYRG